jgi:flagellar motor switch protein FliG
MMGMNANLRKAAVLLKSVDADTAATLLAQLSTTEAMALREAIRGLGPIDPNEQADVLADFRRDRPLVEEPSNCGVELSLSSLDQPMAQPSLASTGTTNEKRFDFLVGAPAKTLATFLAREHAQTIAVVLAHLPAERAAAVLAALPENSQAEAMERLSNLGDTDSESVAMLENELAAWVKARVGDSGRRGQRRDTITSIFAAADAKTRDTLVARLQARNPEFAYKTQPAQPDRAPPSPKTYNHEYRVVRSIAKRHRVNSQLNALIAEQLPRTPIVKATPPSAPALPRIDFDQLIHMDSRMLAQLLEVADPNLLALALAGSKDDLVERICDQMPKQVAKVFRREMRRMGPTRLSDVEAAQRAIADLAARQIALRRARATHSAQTLST